VDEFDENNNIPELTISELSGVIKRTMEDAFGRVRLRGEVSGFRGPHSSGHSYFTLKDENARIDAVIWRGVYQMLDVKPEEGLEVIATGKVTTYPGRSVYQIVIDHLEPAGIGALMALLEERRRKLAAEGLFDEGRKQVLPYLPQVIGVVTSPTGSVIRDILHRISDRFAAHVLVWPVRVQGDTSASEVAAAAPAMPARGIRIRFSPRLTATAETVMASHRFGYPDIVRTEPAAPVAILTNCPQLKITSEAAALRYSAP